jgi:hypothetical protein
MNVLRKIRVSYRQYIIQSSLVINPSCMRHFDLRPVTLYDHFSLQIA